jgi:hypothetical protein
VQVKITLEPSDTYSVKVVSKSSFDTLYEIDDVYNDALAEVIRGLERQV